MGLFALAPGLPFLPFIAGAGALVGAGVWQLSATQKVEDDEKQKAAEEASAAAAEPKEPSLGDLLDVDEIHVEFAPDLIAMAMDESSGLAGRIANMRRHVATEFGFITPEVRLTDNPALPVGRYAIRIQGVECATDTLRPGQVLTLLGENPNFAVPGEDVKEPVYGAAARWVPEARQEEAAILGLPVIAPVEVVATHLLETIQRNFGKLLTRRALKNLLEEFCKPSDAARADSNKSLLDDYVPEKISLDLLQSVLRLLLDERAPIRNLSLILEAIAEAKGHLQTPDLIAEYVRQRIGFVLVSRLVDARGSLPLIQLAPEWEPIFQMHESGDGSTADVALPPTEFNRLAASIRDKISAAAADGRYPAVVTSTKRRRFLKEVLSAKGIGNPVLSFEEIGGHAKPAVLGLA